MARVNFNCPDELLEQLKACAKKRKVTLTELLVEAATAVMAPKPKLTGLTRRRDEEAPPAIVGRASVNKLDIPFGPPPVVPGSRLKQPAKRKP